MRRTWTLASLIALLGLSACAAPEGTLPSLASAPPPAAASPGYQVLPAEPLIGKWGLASYRVEKDRARIEKVARAQCSNAYVITKGPTDGVMMHVADDPKLYELELKKASDGKTYLGFNAPPGDPQDREVLELTSKVIVLRFVDPDIDQRYGTFIYVRC